MTRTLRNLKNLLQRQRSPDIETLRPEEVLITQHRNSIRNRYSPDPAPRLNCNAKRQTSDLDTFIKGHSVIALVDTDAYYSVISGTIAAKLKKVRTTWEGLEISRTEGNLVILAGICRAIVTINSQIYLFISHALLYYSIAREMAS